MTMTDKSEKCDRRVVKTKRAIRNAFIKLLAEKDFNQITIKDIADEADIDRKTLYNHYSGIYEIREELENELTALLEDAVVELDFRKNLKNPQHLFEILTDLLTSHLELCGYLMKINARSHIVRKIDSVLKHRIRDVMQESGLIVDSSKIDLCVEYVSSGILAVYQNWFNSDRSRPLKEISQDVGNLVYYGLQSFVDAHGGE